MAAHRRVDGRIVGPRIPGEERRGRYDLPSLAVAALRYVLVDPGLLARVQVSRRGAAAIVPRRRREALDRRDTALTERRRRKTARPRGTPSTSTVQAPQSPRPQPNFVPGRSR
jgi:hypothetical protein